VCFINILDNNLISQCQAQKLSSMHVEHPGTKVHMYTCISILHLQSSICPCSVLHLFETAGCQINTHDATTCCAGSKAVTMACASTWCTCMCIPHHRTQPHCGTSQQTTARANMETLHGASQHKETGTAAAHPTPTVRLSNMLAAQVHTDYQGEVRAAPNN